MTTDPKIRTCKAPFFAETNVNVNNNLFLLSSFSARNEADTKGGANGKGVEPVTTYERVLFYCFSFLDTKYKVKLKLFRSKDPKRTVNTVPPIKKSRIKLSRGTVLSQQVGNRVQRSGVTTTSFCPLCEWSILLLCKRPRYLYSERWWRESCRKRKQE